MEMNLISRDDLKAKLDRGESFKLLMVLGDWAFQAKHIPGSLNVHTPSQAKELLVETDEIIVYCSDEACIASRQAYRMLIKAGFTNVRRYAGGILDWENAGYPLEGEAVGL